jgi:hypothetical protein
MNKKFLAATALFTQLAAGAALACGDDTARTEQVLGESKNETKKIAARLEQARKDFTDDIHTLEAEFGVDMHDPNALSLENRFPGKVKQRVYVTAELCEPHTDKQGRTGIYISSSEPLSRDTQLNTFSYIPGRKDYSEATIYQKGDARKTLLSDPELRQALEQRAAINARYCSFRRSDLGDAWKQIDNRLATESIDDLMKGAYARYTRMFSMDNARIVESASLRNSHAINITYKKDNSHMTMYMAGEVADILRIEQDLTRKGIATDRETSLDIKGQVEKEYNEIPAPLLVGP